MNCKKENSTPHYLQGFNRTCCAYAPQQKHIKKHGRKKKKQLSTDMHVIGVSTSQINPDTKMVPCRAGWEVTTEQCSLALPGFKKKPLTRGPHGAWAHTSAAVTARAVTAPDLRRVELTLRNLIL